MSESLISNDKQCFICGTTRDLERHHIFGGIGRRSLSEKYGCWLYLCRTHHNVSPTGIHFDKRLDRTIKALCQAEWEELNGTTEDFVRVFGKSYK